MIGDPLYNDEARRRPSSYTEVGRTDDFLLAMYNGDEGIDTYIRGDLVRDVATYSGTHYSSDGVRWVWSPAFWRQLHPNVEWGTVTGGTDPVRILKKLAELGHISRCSGEEAHF